MRLNVRMLTFSAAITALTLTASAADPVFISFLSNNSQVASTVPGNGDVNPYGIAVVPVTTGKLVANNFLVSNFNNISNLQGTGTTIVQITPQGNVSVFAAINGGTLPGACPGGVGLTTALVALRSGWVIVGSLPTADGTATTASAGCLIVLNREGQPIATISGNGVNGPWDMTAVDLGTSAILFVTNVLNGTVAGGGNVVNQGTVQRIVLSTPSNGTPQVLSNTIIGSGFAERTDPAALVIGPTGVAYSSVTGDLYVADTLNNRIASISDPLRTMNNAGTGTTVSQGGALNGPLGVAIVPSGDILSVNSNDGNIVETTPRGSQVAVKNLDITNTGAGTLFGLVVVNHGIYYVDDGNNTLDLFN